MSANEKFILRSVSSQKTKTRSLTQRYPAMLRGQPYFHVPVTHIRILHADPENLQIGVLGARQPLHGILGYDADS